MGSSIIVAATTSANVMFLTYTSVWTQNTLFTSFASPYVGLSSDNGANLALLYTLTSTAPVNTLDYITSTNGGGSWGTANVVASTSEAIVGASIPTSEYTQSSDYEAVWESGTANPYTVRFFSNATAYAYQWYSGSSPTAPPTLRYLAQPLPTTPQAQRQTPITATP